HRGHHVAAEVVEERGALGADRADVHADVHVGPVLHGGQHGLEHVDVQAAAQAAVGGDDDEADAPRRPLFHIDVAVLRRGVGDVADDTADGVGVGLAQLHALLRLAHLARGHHLHGAGDLLSILDTRDLAAYLFSAGHSSYQVCVATKLSRAALKAAPISSD